MKHFYSVFLATVLAATTLLTGCKEKLDLENMDGQAELKMGLAVPVGTMSATMGDVIGQVGDKANIYIKQPGDNALDYLEDYTLFFRDTFRINRQFHAIDLSKYVGDSNNEFKPADKATSPLSTRQVIEFDMPVKFDNINCTLTDERLDSMYITDAKFTTNLTKNFNIERPDIEKVELIFPSCMLNYADKTPLAPKELDLSSGFGSDIVITMSDFLIKLTVNDLYEPWAPGNVTNTLNFKVRFTINPTAPIAFDATSCFTYKFHVDFLEYKALWGFFKPGKDMIDEHIVDLAKEWAPWKRIKNLKMRFAKPTIEIFCEHAIGAKLQVNAEYLYVEPMGHPEQRVYGKFGMSQGKTEVAHIDDFPAKDSPFDTTVNAWVYKFLYTGGGGNQHKGDIDQMFDVRPDFLGYKYNIDLQDHDPNTQFRMTNNTKLAIDAITTVPFVFNEGSTGGWEDTTSVNFEKVDYDSLLSSVKFIDTIKTSDVKLFIAAKNTLPFIVEASYKFLDAAGQEVVLDLITEENKTDKVMTIPVPKSFDSHGIAQTPGENMLIISINRQQFDQLKRIKKVCYDARLYGNPCTVVMTSESALKTTIGVGATVDAIFDITKLK